MLVDAIGPDLISNNVKSDVAQRGQVRSGSDQVEDKLLSDKKNLFKHFLPLTVIIGG